MIEPGIYEKLPMEEYHKKVNGVSKSNLVDFFYAPTEEHYLALEGKEGDLLTIGEIGHMMILEPERYDNEVVIPPPSVLAKNGARSGNAWKAWKKEQDDNDKLIMTQKDKDSLDRIRENLVKKKSASELLLEGGYAETSFFWKDVDTGIQCKCRPDFLPGGYVVTDLKFTGASASNFEFGRIGDRLRYLWSAAWTLEGVSICTKIPHNEYCFIVIELERPWGIRVLRPEQSDIMLATADMQPTRDGLFNCIMDDVWQGYPDEIEPYPVPGYAYKRMENTGGNEIYD